MINVSQSFHRTSANAVDDTLTLTKAQMLAVNDNLMPSKYLTVCQDDGYIYLYDKSATPNGTTGKFTKFEGGGSSTVLKQTLTAGSTTVTFTNLPTTGDHVVSFYNSLGINYTAIEPDTGEVTLTYPEQGSDMAVYCEIKGV